jgi:NAD(P)H-quinone oxidoreductase subunit 5
LGDVALLLAVAFLYCAFDTFDFHDIFETVDRGMSGLSKDQVDLINLAGVFLAAGAMTKSAQFPFHFWLPETMETPTPVSALMHAGIINAGGFLIIRLSPVFDHAAGAGMLLTVAGALTAVYGSLVMITQNNIKQKLAYSTISQMGMMIFACGIGAYSLALFHIVAHSLYKAYAFLSTGTLVAERTKLAIPLRPWSMSMAVLCSIICGTLVILGLYLDSGLYLPSLTYGAVLLLGVVQNMNLPRLKDAYGGFLPLIVGASLIGGVLLYLGLEQGLGHYVATEIATPETVSSWRHPIFLVNAFGYLIFAVGFCLSNALLAQKSPFSRRLYMYLWNGGYFGHYTTRALLRLWPV